MLSWIPFSRANFSSLLSRTPQDLLWCSALGWEPWLDSDSLLEDESWFLLLASISSPFMVNGGVMLGPPRYGVEPHKEIFYQQVVVVVVVVDVVVYGK